MGEKTFDPTHRRLQQARQQGQIAVSQDVVKLTRLAVGVEVLFAVEPLGRAWLAGLLHAAEAAAGKPFASGLAGLLTALQPALWGLLGVPVAAAVLGVLATVVQTRFNLATRALAESPKKLDPAANLRNLFSARKLLMLPLGLAKVASVLAVCTVVVKARVPDMVLLVGVSVEQSLAASLALLHSLARSLVLTLLAWAILDVMLQRLLTWRSLRMDMNEVRRDYKEMQGDPHMKGHRKQLAHEIVNEVTPRLDARASAVVVNPDHLAVALALDPEGRRLPTVVAKAEAAKAAWLRLEAAERRLPIIRYVPLARELYRQAEPGAVVPRSCLRATALVQRLVESIPTDNPYLGDPDCAFMVDPRQAESVLASKSPSISLRVGRLDDPAIAVNDVIGPGA